MSLPSPELPSPVDETLPQFKSLRFLVIDDNPDGRFLISKTLMRKFPNSVISECQTAEAAFRILNEERVSLIISHRTFEFDGVSLIRELRQVNPTVPIVMMSGIDRRELAMEAGAADFLTYDEWLMVGNKVALLLTERGIQDTGPGGVGGKSLGR